MKETIGYLNFRKYFLGGVDDLFLEIGLYLLRNTVRESILCYSILYSLQNCLVLNVFFTGQERVHKGKRCIFSLGVGAVPQTSYCKELGKYSRTDFEGSVEELGTTSAQQFNIFLNRNPSGSCQTLRITLLAVFLGTGLEYLPIFPAFSG